VTEIISCIGYPMASMVTGPDNPRLFPWRYLKKWAHKNCSHTIQEPKCNKKDETATINQELLYRVSDDFVNHLRQGTANEGGHLPDVIQSNKPITLYRKLVHFTSSFSYCVKYYHVSKCVCQVCSILHNKIITGMWTGKIWCLEIHPWEI
jgi:hypothetical protein